MNPKLLVGLSGLIRKSIRESSLYSFAVFGANYLYRDFNRRLAQHNGTISPDVLGIEVTNYCPRNCKGCYVPEQIKSDRTVIEEPLLLSAVSQAKNLRIRNFGFMGGEPMTSDTIPVTLKAISQNPFISFVYCTNGDYISHNNVSYFVDYPNVGFLLSIDGFKETNDRIRGKSSYSSIIAASQQLKDMKRIISAAVTVRKENIDEVLSEDFVNHLINQGFSYVVWVKYKDNKKGEALLPEKEFSERLSRLRESTTTKPIFQQTNIVGDFFLFNRNAAHHTVYLSVNGDVHIDREDMLSYKGNLNKKTLNEILKESLQEYQSKYSNSFCFANKHLENCL